MASHEALISQVNSLFDYYDGNQNGYIEKQEKDRLMHDLKLELRVKKNISEEDFSKLIIHLNKSYQGRITRDELYAVLKLIN